MTDNEILARWQGWKDISNEVVWVSHPIQHPNGATRINWPDYPNDDAAAMSLLDTLVEKRFIPVLEFSEDFNGWRCAVYHNGYLGRCIVDIESGPTRREAIISACLEVARKEAKGNG